MNGKEQRYQTIFESIVDFAIIAIDPEGRVTRWNSGAERTLGWTAAEMVGRPIEQFFTPEDRAADRPGLEMRKALEDGGAPDERWHLKKDGSRFWASGEMMPIRGEAGNNEGFVKVLRDRTQQREAAETNRADAEFLRSVLESLNDCIKILDLDANLLFMSEGSRRAMEVSDFDAIRGCPWPDFWHGDGHVQARAAVEAAKRGETGRFVAAAETMAGNSRCWDVQVSPIYGADGRPEKLLVVSRDITATHDAAAALRASEARWRSLFARLQEGFILGELIRDAAGHVTDWRYLDVNPAWGELVGISPEAAVGRTIRELFPDVEDIWIAEMAGVVATGQPITFDRQVGTIGRWYEGHAFAMEHDRFGVMFLDVTERRLAERRRAALIEVDERLRDVEDLAEMSFVAAEVMGQAMLVGRAGYGTVDPGVDTVTIARDWTLPGFAGLSGTLSFREFGSYIDDLRAGRPVIVADVAQDRRTAAHVGAFENLGIKALVNLPLVEHGVLVAIFYVNAATPRVWTGEELDFMRNIAARTRSAVERRRVENGLRDFTASLEQQVEERTRERDRTWTLIPDLFAIIGTDGRFRRINPAWTTVLGYAATELLGRSLIAFAHADDVEALDTALGQLIERRPVHDLQIRLRQKEGGYRAYSWTSVPEGSEFYVVARDVTERGVLEEQLRQSQKMEAVGQLTGGIAHDFNNLLTGITGSLELMQARLGQGRLTDVDRYVNAAQSAAKRAAALTHRLLAFSRRQTLAPTPTDMNRLVAGMQDLIERTTGPSVTVEPVAKAELWTVLVDQSQLENALLNLCINARDAMPDGGRLVIETNNHHLGARAARARGIPPGQYVSLCVSDNGTGMPPEVVARAFDPFFTTKPIGQGTGLGLSMIYGFVRQSGGQVRVHSEVGQGTTMCIYLPRHVGVAEDLAAPAELADAPRAVQGQTVLVVDDDPTVRMLMTEVLQDLGYAAIEAPDGASGLKILQSDVRIDLLVTDVGLPGGMNGRQVADAARVVRPEMKVLFITGYAESAVLGHGHLDPGMHVLTKPFAMEVLASRIKAVIEEGTPVAAG